MSSSKLSSLSRALHDDALRPLRKPLLTDSYEPFDPDKVGPRMGPKKLMIVTQMGYTKPARAKGIQDFEKTTLLENPLEWSQSAVDHLGDDVSAPIQHRP